MLIGELLRAGVGQMLDQRRQQMQAQTVAGALETTPVGTAFTWRNPHRGNCESAIATRPFQRPALYYREFQQESRRWQPSKRATDEPFEASPPSETEGSGDNPH